MTVCNWCKTFDFQNKKNNKQQIKWFCEYCRSSGISMKFYRTQQSNVVLMKKKIKCFHLMDLALNICDRANRHRSIQVEVFIEWPKKMCHFVVLWSRLKIYYTINTRQHTTELQRILIEWKRVKEWESAWTCIQRMECMLHFIVCLFVFTVYNNICI